MRSHLIAAIRARFALPARRSRDGSVAVVVALLLVVLIGFAALGTEVVALLMTSRQMQSAADSAALAAATARAEGYPTAVANEAVAIARDRGFVNGAVNPTTTVAVSSPPTTGAYVGNPAAVQVVITQVQPLLLTALFHGSAYTLTARAVGLGTPCLLAFDGSTDGALLADNGASVLLNKCGIASNSTSISAIQAKGNGQITASWLNVVGNTSATKGGTITVSGITRTGAPPVADPYAGLAVPTPGTCLSGGAIDNQTIALPAGTYCAPDGISLTHASNVTLNGVYILKDSSLVVKGSSTFSGTATIVLAGTGTGTNIGNVTISNGGILNLTAPATGPTAGMVFFQDIRAPATGGKSTNDFGITANTLNGAVYFPNTTVNYSSGSSTASVCTLLIARQIAFFQNTGIRLNCSALGMGRVLARLVE